MKKFLVLLFVGCMTQASAQVGAGLVMAVDIYQRYVNPVEEGVDAGRSAGAAISSLALGPKIWMGGNNFSFSVEGQAHIAPLAFSVTEYKGLGAVAFPLIGKFNFGAASGFNEDKLLGWSLGGGIQYNRTELFGVSNKYPDLERSFFPTYVGELAMSLGIAGFDFGFYTRLGFGEDKARSFNTGFVLNFNFNQMARMGKRFKNKNEAKESSVSL
jgi:hypothetical protein